MRRSASEIIRNLESRIARLESRRASNNSTYKQSSSKDLKEFLAFCEKFNLKKVGDPVWIDAMNREEGEDDLWTAMMNPIAREGLNHITRKNIWVLNPKGVQMVQGNKTSRRASNQRQAKMSYDRWMKRVDDEVGSLIMVSVHDLVDYDSYSLWEAGVSPKRAAKIIIRNDGTFQGML